MKENKTASDLSQQSVRDELFRIIRDNFIAGRSDVELGFEDSLIEGGVIDSTGVLELVTFIEERFGIKVEDEELVPENLDSIKNLLDFLHRKGIY